jgi:hypothetical protein
LQNQLSLAKDGENLIEGEMMIVKAMFIYFALLWIIVLSVMIHRRRQPKAFPELRHSRRVGGICPCRSGVEDRHAIE